MISYNRIICQFQLIKPTYKTIFVLGTFFGCKEQYFEMKGIPLPKIKH